MKGGVVYTTDRQIIERLLIPAMMQAVLLGMQKSLADDGGLLDPIKVLLTAAMKEAVADILPDRVEKVMRRAKRVSTQARAVQRSLHREREQVVYASEC